MTISSAGLPLIAQANSGTVRSSLSKSYQYIPCNLILHQTHRYLNPSPGHSHKSYIAEGSGVGLRYKNEVRAYITFFIIFAIQYGTPLLKLRRTRSVYRVARQRSAKPFTAVRIRHRPQQNPPRKRRDFCFSADSGLTEGGDKTKRPEEPKAQGFC